MAFGSRIFFAISDTVTRANFTLALRLNFDDACIIA
jgi:hypothetical protein